MKNAKVGSEKILRAVKPHRVAGVPVRSGVKAGLRDPGRGRDPGGGPRDPGGASDRGGFFDPGRGRPG